jgi:hypothetical protein
MAALMPLAGWLWLAAAAGAQELVIPEVSYPELPNEASVLEGFVPPGWRLEAKAEGDLDRDGDADLALVLRQQDPKNVFVNEGLGENPFDTNPRILAVAAREPSGGYRLAVANRTLIPRRIDPVQSDPLSELGRIDIARGALRVTLYRFASAGGWSMGTTSFAFRLRGGALELIGYDRDATARNTGETEEVSINYLTGRRKLARGSIERDGTMVTWRKLPPGPLLTIGQIGDGLSFNAD